MNFEPLKQLMDDWTTFYNPGNAVEIYLHGERVFKYASGLKDVENNLRMSGSEHFFIYSCSKVATAVAGVQLIEQGKILPTEPLSDYLPEFKNMMIKTPEGDLVPAKNPILVGHLFDMTSGFSYDSGSLKEAVKQKGLPMDTCSVIRTLSERPLSFEPGTNFQYSLSHDALAYLIELVSGMKFKDYMRQNIFEPLEMFDTAYHPTNAMLKNLAPIYRFQVDNGPEDLVEAQKTGGIQEGKHILQPSVNNFEFSPEYDSGGAGIITTVSDYAKFAGALGNYGTAKNGARILSEAGIDLLRTTRVKHDTLPGWNWKQYKGYDYGFGVRVMADKSHGSLSNIGEFGWCGAAGSAVICDPKAGLGVFFAQHTLNPREDFYFPRLRNIIYACL